MHPEQPRSPDPADAVFLFDTTHAALWAEEVASLAGIPAELIPAPAGLRARCNLALQTFPEEFAALREQLARAGVPLSAA